MPSNYEKLSQMLSKDVSKENPLDTLGTLGDIADSYTGAPVRSALKAMQDSGSLKEMGKAYANQFGQDQSQAPTSEQLVANDPTTAPYRDTLLPTAVQLGTDPLTWAPLGGELKGIKSLLGKIPEGAKAAESLADLGKADRLGDVNQMSRDFITKASPAHGDRFNLNPDVYNTQEGYNIPSNVSTRANLIGKGQEGLSSDELKSMSSDATRNIEVPNNVEPIDKYSNILKMLKQKAN